MVTFNGEKFLAQQLNSLKNQIGVELEVVALDNGSDDGTVKILEKFQRIGLVKGIFHSKNLDPSSAFIRLLEEVETDLPVAFCDQDDVWYEVKMSQMLRLIDSPEPLLIYCGRDLLIENELQVVENSIAARKVMWKNAMIESLAPGNTMLLNVNAVKAVQEAKLRGIRHYDSAISLLISLVGDVKYCNKSLLAYRIHDTNFVGLRRRYDYIQIFDRVKNYLAQADEIEKSLSKFPPNEKTFEFSMNIADLKSGKLGRIMRGSFTSGLYRQNQFETKLFRISIFLYLMFSRKVSRYSL